MKIYKVCEAKHGRGGTEPYPKMILAREDASVLSIATTAGYKNHRRADYRYWHRLAYAEARRRGLL